MAQIKVVGIGDSDSLKVGEQVVAIGNALGYGQSVTTGIVSATNRAISSGSSNGKTTPLLIALILRNIFRQMRQSILVTAVRIGEHEG